MVDYLFRWNDARRTGSQPDLDCDDQIMTNCIACGKPITTKRMEGVGITLARVWTHFSFIANLSHVAIPPDDER